MPIYSNNASCLMELFEALNDTDGFSQVSTNAKKYLLVFGVHKNVSILDFKALCIDIKVVANKDLGCQRKWILTHQHCTTCLPHAKSRFSTMSTILISSYRRAH